MGIENVQTQGCFVSEQTVIYPSGDNVFSKIKLYSLLSDSVIRTIVFTVDDVQEVSGDL